MVIDVITQPARPIGYLFSQAVTEFARHWSIYFVLAYKDIIFTLLTYYTDLNPAIPSSKVLTSLVCVIYFFQLPQLSDSRYFGPDIQGIKSISSGQIKLSVTENAPKGTIVGKLSAFMPDYIIANPRLRILQNHFFDIHSDSSVYVIGPLDRDDNPQLCTESGYPFECIWGGIALMENGQYMDIHIAIQDENDNPPSWSESTINVDVLEEMSTEFRVELPAATDLDVGENGIVRYTLVENTSYHDVFKLEVKSRDTNSHFTSKDNPHRLLNTSLIFRIVKRLDREEKSFHKLFILAEDGSKPYHTGTLVVNIHVKDENDHSPKFASSLYFGEIYENTLVGTEIQVKPVSFHNISESFNGIVNQVTAEDRDEGVNGAVRYSLEALADPSVIRTFNLEQYTGVLRLVRELPFDSSQREWRFKVIAIDNGKVHRSASTIIHLILLERNKFAPEIQVRIQASSAYGLEMMLEQNGNGNREIAIPENRLPPETPLAIVTVADRDGGSGGEFSCELGSCKHSEGKSQISIIEIFNLSYSVTVMNWKVFHLFALHAIDREFNSSEREICILCRDQGIPQLSSTYVLQLNILDENDNAPVFSKQKYEFKVLENLPLNSTIGHVLATDADNGDNGRVSYHIIWSETVPVEDRMIMVDEDGRIWSTEQLDRETKHTGYHFTVTANDHGENKSLHSKVEVSIMLLDTNDCSPEFGEQYYNFSVTEDAQETQLFGRWVGQVSATDRDLGLNADITYRFVERNLPFMIFKNGSILTTDSLDREKRAVYHTTVLAIDGGDFNAMGDESNGEQLSTPSFSPEMGSSDSIHTVAVPVRITIMDINDNPPQFLYSNTSSQRVHLSINEKPGFLVTRFTAFDRDEGSNGHVLYSFLLNDQSGRPERLDQVFKLIPDTGELIVIADLKDLSEVLIRFGVEARDQGIPSLSTVIDFEVLLGETPPTQRSTSRAYTDDRMDFIKQWLTGQRQYGKINTSDLDGLQKPRIEMNKLIIICTLVSTAAICMVLILATCLISQRSVFKSLSRWMHPSPHVLAEPKTSPAVLEANVQNFASDLYTMRSYDYLPSVLPNEQERASSSGHGLIQSRSRIPTLVSGTGAKEGDSRSPNATEAEPVPADLPGVSIWDLSCLPHHQALVHTGETFQPVLALVEPVTPQTNSFPLPLKTPNSNDSLSLQDIVPANGLRLVAVTISGVDQTTPVYDLQRSHQLAQHVAIDCPQGIMLQRAFVQQPGNQCYSAESDVDSGHGGSLNNPNGFHGMQMKGNSFGPVDIDGGFLSNNQISGLALRNMHEMSGVQAVPVEQRLQNQTFQSVLLALPKLREDLVMYDTSPNDKYEEAAGDR